MMIKRLNRNFIMLDNKLIAHKGIYGYSNRLKRRIEPNSFESCKIAIENDIPFECDIRNTLDNIPVLAHDNVLEIINNKKIRVNKYTYNQLCEMLKEKAPSKLEDILKLNNGRVGVIVDAKEAHIFYPKYRKNLFSTLNKYSQNTEIILQSFNPFFMLSSRNVLKNVITCQLICRGKTILDSFRAPKTLAYWYERIISLICFISRTDAINMENHSNSKWQQRTKFFISRSENVRVAKRREMLLDRLENSIYKGIKRFHKFIDKTQLKLVKLAHELTKKPVLAFTIENESDFNLMESIYIVSYIADFNSYGVEEYIKKMKKK